MEMMDVFEAVPAVVILVSVALTELLKKFVKGQKAKKILMDLIWLPSMIVGVCAAYFEVDTFLSKEGIKLAITYGILGPFVVLVVKPLLKQAEVRKARKRTSTPPQG